MALNWKLRLGLYILQLYEDLRLTRWRTVEKERKWAAKPPANPTPVTGVVDRLIYTPACDIPIRVYNPPGSGPFPLFIYLHGGGWVIGGLEAQDEVCRLLCNDSGCVVVSVDYRLAPEYKHPAASDDALAAVRWVASHASEINCDPACIALGGESAGAHLTAVTTLRLRDEGDTIRLRGQILVQPATRLHGPPTESYLRYGRNYGLSSKSIEWFVAQYLNDPKEAEQPYVSPLDAPDLRNLPPALVITGEYDPLRDEGEQYAERLQHAGVPVTVSCYPAMIHGFFTMSRILKEGTQAIKEACEWLRQV